MEKNMLKEKSAVLLAAVLCAAVASAAPMKFLLFNVWGDYFKNPVNEREAAIESTIRKYSPDVVALQEMTPAWWESPMLGNLSTEYGVVRGDEEDALKRAGAKGPRKPRWINHEPLLYRKSRLALLDSGLDFFHLRLGAESDVIREYDVLQIVWRIAEIRHSSGTDRKPKKLKARSVLFCLSNAIQSKGV